MFQPQKIKVLVALCILISSCNAVGLGQTNTSCDLTPPKIKDEDFLFNCSHRGIYTIPTDWPNDVSKIKRDNNVLVSFFNNAITNLTKLPPIPGSRIAFVFKYNKIIEIDDGVFSDVDRVSYVDLSKNNISGHVLRGKIFQGPFQNGIYSNIALETLDLGYNNINSLDMFLFQYTPNLTRLSLNNNPIGILNAETIHAISSATSLQILDLASTNISAIPVNTFNGLLNLRNIDLSNNNFVTAPESLNLIGRSLKFLTFNNNPIVELNDDSFIGLTNLKHLEVMDNSYLEEVKRRTFSPLKSLNILYLSNNSNLRYISHNAFGGLENAWTLKEVYLDDNDLSELSTDLMPWNKLKVLGMTGNKWLCNCDLANIVTTQGAGKKFKTHEIPYCTAPMRLSGTHITNITTTYYCPALDNTLTGRKSFSISDLKVKHVLWSIFGVGVIVCIGMGLGLLFNAVRALYNKNIHSQPIRYINLNSDTSFA